MRLLARSLFVLPLLLVGCGNDEFGDGSSALVITERCETGGEGTLSDGDALSGNVRGDGTTVDGSWEHASASVVLGEPNWIACRINGSRIADFSGPARVDGASGYTFRVQVQDLAVEGVPEIRHAATSTETITATRYYSPSQWEDGALAIDSHVSVVVPTELDVTVGNGANHWTWLTFERTLYGDTITCRYRGGAGTGQPSTADEIEGGETYSLQRCTGELEGTPSVEGGDSVDITSLTLHVQSGACDFPSGEGQTTVAASIQVTAYAPLQQDFYRILVFDNTTGEQVLSREGELASGDLTITQL